MLRVFLKLGNTSFGGPIAHLGYFRAEFVSRRAWMGEREFAELLALCQFLPGPASSQLGFAIGLHRAGWRGALAAFAGFTLPSAALMTAFAFGATLFRGTLGAGALAGLQIAAVAIVAQAVLGMARSLTPDARRAGIAAVGAILTLGWAGSLGQLAAIVLGAVAGFALCREPAAPGGGALDTGSGAGPESGLENGLNFGIRRRFGALSLAILATLLIATPILAALSRDGGIRLFDAFFRSGALVFGGGHVVLPLLQSSVVAPGWVTQAQFLDGYGAAQAMPGPLFTLAGYLGAVSSVGPGGVPGALIALAGIFLPGFLVLVGVLPFWAALRRRRGAQAAVRGANAAVVGILAAALYTPVFTSAISGPGPFGLALVAFVLLVAWRMPPLLVVAVGAVGGMLLAVLGM